MVTVALAGIVESWIDKQLTRDILVKLEGKGILPLQLRTVIGGVSIQTGLPVDIIREFPCQVHGAHRTEIMQHVVIFLQSVTRGQFFSAHISEVILQR